MSASGLRHRLDIVTREMNVARHPAMLAELDNEYPHSIRWLESPYPLHRYTCLMHALGFEEKRRYVEIAGSGHGEVYAGVDFAHWLERNALEEIGASDAVLGDLVFYFQANRFRHAGLCDGGCRVTSKWGTGGLYNHEQDEVPASYGSDIRWYKGLNAETAMHRFEEFADLHRCGVG